MLRKKDDKNVKENESQEENRKLIDEKSQGKN